MKEKQITKEEVVKAVKELDENLSEEDEAFKVACMLFTGVYIGANIKRISELLDYPLEEIKKYEKNLRKSKIWRYRKTSCNWMAKDDGIIAFWCDVNVGLGHLRRTD